MYRPQLLVSAGLVFVLWTSTTAGSAGQAPTDATAGYLELVAREFGTPAGELRILAEDQLDIEELPVLLVISRESGISPSALLAYRRSGQPWMTIAARQQLDSTLFELSIPPDQAGSLLERAQRAFAEASPSERGRISLNDEEVVALENVRLLSEGLRRPAADVVRARGDTSSFVEAYALLTGS